MSSTTDSTRGGERGDKENACRGAGAGCDESRFVLLVVIRQRSQDRLTDPHTPVILARDIIYPRPYKIRQRYRTGYTYRLHGKGVGFGHGLNLDYAVVMSSSLLLRLCA